MLLCFCSSPHGLNGKPDDLRANGPEPCYSSCAPQTSRMDITGACQGCRISGSIPILLSPNLSLNQILGGVIWALIFERMKDSPINISQSTVSPCPSSNHTSTGTHLSQTRLSMFTLLPCEKVHVRGTIGHVGKREPGEAYYRSWICVLWFKSGGLGPF